MAMEITDMLVEILRHLHPRSLATARCICEAWRAAIDDHRLLRASQLPLSLDGVIFDTRDPDAPMFFSRRSTARKIKIGFTYLDDSPGEEKGWYWPVYDCCNGLLLLYKHVVNPATREWVRLSPPPRSCVVSDCARCDSNRNRYLVYDPTVSPHYEVFLMPQIPSVLPAGHILKHTYHGAMTMEWPPSTYIIHAFSSKTGCWKERSLVGEGDATGTVADIEVASRSVDYLYYSAYWQGALYARCECGFVLRISLSDDKYKVTKLPRGNEGVPRLGKSKKGVYCALWHGRRTFEIWFLDESRGRMEWELRNEINLQSIHTYYLNVHGDDGPWIQQLHGQKVWFFINEENEEALPNDDFEWDSEDGNTVATADLPQYNDRDAPYFECLGFHPYKDIVLLHWSNETIAYHFDSSKVRYLGNMKYPCTEIEVSFAYAPCWTRVLPGSSEC